MAEPQDTHERALAVNLDRSIFGTFAEIGAGQEVARWFLRVGGAAGTVAKTISAYDMTLSDAIYGKSGRYVSRERLAAMLDHEYALLLERLDAARGAESRFFVFADTVAARNFAGTNECHGWMGIRFQSTPRGAPDDILIHVNMMDPVNLLQQQALGILGVNLIYTAFHRPGSAEQALKSLFAGLSLERLELDFVQLGGPELRGVDSRALGLGLVRQAVAQVVVFGEDGALAPPTEVLRKRPIVLERSRVDTVGATDARMLEAACRELAGESGQSAREPLGLGEITLHPPLAREAPGDAAILERAARLQSLGRPVAVTRYAEAYRLTGYLRRYTNEPIRFAAGAGSLLELFAASVYQDLAGGLLEGLGKLLADNVRVYAYPEAAERLRELLASLPIDPATVSFAADGLVRFDQVRFDPPLGHLQAYLLEAGWLLPLGGAI
jgi:hypothetical protein